MRQRSSGPTGLAAVLLMVLGATAAAAEEPAAAPVSPTSAPALPGAAPEVATPDAPASAPADAAAAKEEEKPRISFEFRVPSEKGGGVIAGSADAVETSGENEATLTGDVEVRFRKLVLRAERLLVHRDTMTVEAEGDVVLDQGSQRIGAAHAEYDLATETGTFWNASAFVAPDHYFSGAVLAKTGEETFEIRNGVFTACAGDPTPDWSLRVARADVRIGGYAFLRHTALRMKKLPLFYWPYLIWPAKSERSTGFLIPNIGYTASRGNYLGIAYYQVLGPAVDLTLHLDGYEKSYAGAGAELRYAPREGTEGDLLYQLLSDRELDQRESRLLWSHTSDKLPGGFRAVIDYNDYSDYDFFREFLRGERENTRAFLYSNAFLSGNWGAQSLSVVVDQRESFTVDDEGFSVVTSTQRQLPELSYRLRKLKLGGSPIYLSLQSTGSWFQTESVDRFNVDYGRFDLAPELTLPLRLAPWMSVSLTAGGRATYWGESVPETRVDEETQVSQRFCGDVVVDASQVYCGDELTRAVPRGEVSVVGPSFSKIIDSPGGRFAKFKHVIEPRFEYNYAGEYADQQRVPRFDEIDLSRSAEIGSVALVNRILAKPSDPEEGGAFEIFSFELSQEFALDDRFLQRSSDGLLKSRESEISAQLRYKPSRAFDLQGRAEWSTLFSGLDSTSLSMRATGERSKLDLTWYTNYNAELGERGSDQARVGLSFDVVRDRLTLATQVNYDILDGAVLQQRNFLTYKSQCWSFVIEAREQVTRRYTARDYRFMLSLKNVGTFLDLNSGDRTSASAGN